MEEKKELQDQIERVEKIEHQQVDLPEYSEGIDVAVAKKHSKRRRFALVLVSLLLFLNYASYSFGRAQGLVEAGAYHSEDFKHHGYMGHHGMRSHGRHGRHGRHGKHFRGKYHGKHHQDHEMEGLRAHGEEEHKPCHGSVGSWLGKVLQPLFGEKNHHTKEHHFDFSIRKGGVPVKVSGSVKGHSKPHEVSKEDQKKHQQNDHVRLF